MLEVQDCCLIIIDVQGKLAQLMHNSNALFRNIGILIKAAKILDIPCLWCQQSPKALGVTVPSIARLLEDNQPINKVTFSCSQNEQFKSQMKTLNRKQILLCGIEAHVCIYQTAVDLLKTDLKPTVIADAVSSRTPDNKQIAIEKLRLEGINISSVEMALFELLKTAEHPKFKEITQLIK